MDLEIEVTAGTVRPISVPATSQDVLILPGDGYLCGWSLRDASGDAPAEAEGAVTTPAAGATIATTTALAAGVYNVTWTVSLAGTPGAGEVNNFELLVGAAVITPSINPGAAGNYPQPPTEVTVPQGAAVLVKAIAAGTAGAEYSASISAEPSNLQDTIVEFQDGARILGEASMTVGNNDRNNFGAMGVRIYTGLNLHVVSGTVTGSVSARFIKAN